MRNRKKWLATLLCGLMASLSFSAIIAMAETTIPVFNEVQIEKEYKMGDTITIPKATLSYDGKELECEGVVMLPNGSVKNVDSLVLTESGNYKIIYKMNVNGEMVSKIVEFDVLNTIFSSTGSKASASYGTNAYLPESYEGLNVKLVPDETLQFNKVINIADLTKNGNIIKFYMTPQYKGTGELNRLYVRLTDIHNPDNYITVQYFMQVTQQNWAWHWILISS